VATGCVVAGPIPSPVSLARQGIGPEGGRRQVGLQPLAFLHQRQRVLLVLRRHPADRAVLAVGALHQSHPGLELGQREVALQRRPGRATPIGILTHVGFHIQDQRLAAFPDRGPSPGPVHSLSSQSGLDNPLESHPSVAVQPHSATVQGQPLSGPEDRSPATSSGRFSNDSISTREVGGTVLLQRQGCPGVGFLPLDWSSLGRTTSRPRQRSRSHRPHVREPRLEIP
jgi:hypothetical protein